GAVGVVVDVEGDAGGDVGRYGAVGRRSQSGCERLGIDRSKVAERAVADRDIARVEARDVFGERDRNRNARLVRRAGHGRGDGDAWEAVIKGDGEWRRRGAGVAGRVGGGAGGDVGGD